MDFYETMRKIYNVRYVCYAFNEGRTCALTLESHCTFIFSLFSIIIHNCDKVKLLARANNLNFTIFFFEYCY